MRCGPDRDDNLARAERLVAAAAGRGAGLIVLPELFAALGRTAALTAAAEPIDGPTVAWASELAARHSIHLVAGSFVEGDGEELYNTSCVLGPSGELVAAYRKVHLFDVDVPGATNRESAVFSGGDRPVVANLGTDGPTLGLSVCYDLRFPELYRIEALMGATMVSVPAAFTAATGVAHWELLVRARAVEDQVGVVAAAQWDVAPNGIECYGHALVVDPWGRVLADAGGEGDGMAVAELDPAAVEAVRARLPSLANRRAEAYRWPSS